jgi:hypothetical protein
MIWIANEFLRLLVELQWPFAQRADKNIKQSGIHAASPQDVQKTDLQWLLQQGLPTVWDHPPSHFACCILLHPFQ